MVDRCEPRNPFLYHDLSQAFSRLVRSEASSKFFPHFPTTFLYFAAKSIHTVHVSLMNPGTLNDEKEEGESLCDLS